MIEKTVVLIKPDGMEKHIVGKIITRFEDAGLSLVGLKLVQLTQDILDVWYSHHKDKPFFHELCLFMMERPVVAMVLEGEDAIHTVFELCGPTDPSEAPEGTIRKDFADSKQRNIVHRSDSLTAAEQEIDLIFAPDEIYTQQAQ